MEIASIVKMKYNIIYDLIRDKIPRTELIREWKDLLRTYNETIHISNETTEIVKILRFCENTYRNELLFN